jgi:hypothetical protein
MRAHVIWLEHRAGSLAELCEALGSAAVNITGVSATTWEDRGALAITTDDPDATAEILAERGAEHHAVELVAAALEHRPGSLAEAARRLADRDISIHALIPMGDREGRRVIGFVVDIPAAARDALGDLAVSDATL